MTKKVLTIIIWIFSASLLLGQNLSTKYFSTSPKDEIRWRTYDSVIDNTDLDSETKADSIINFAQIEYDLQQYSKTRELCEIALSINPDLGEAHNLIGKSYVSSSKLCNEVDGMNHRIKEDIIWVAIDEWELAISKTNSKREEAIILIERYSDFLPSKEHFRSCFGKSTLNEGDDFYVGCWIQKNTKIRFNTE